MKILCAFLICFTILAQGSVRTLTDKEISTTFVGTWLDSPSGKAAAHSKATYFDNGQGFELVWFGDEPESTAMRLDTSWSVTNNILTLTCVKSSNPQLVPVGIQLKDHILSISSDQFIYEPIGYGDGKPHVKIKASKSD
jgi:hypothetical protein